MENLISVGQLHDICTRKDVELLFRPGEIQALTWLVYPIVLHRLPPTGGTENSFIAFWDENVCQILEVLIPDGQSIRDSNLHTETKKLRPDYGFLLNNLCLF